MRYNSARSQIMGITMSVAFAKDWARWLARVLCALKGCWVQNVSRRRTPKLSMASALRRTFSFLGGIEDRVGPGEWSNTKMSGASVLAWFSALQGSAISCKRN
jgi:hypothetical protein